MTTRVTQRMMMQTSLTSLQTGLAQLSKTQEQLTTGKILNRPSDSPTDTTTAMRLQASITEQTQYARNAQDATAWLGEADTTLRSMNDQLTRAHDLALQGANSGASSQTSMDALATEVDQIRQGMISAANTTYLDRPVFGGITPGKTAYNADGTFAGTAGSVMRTVGPNVKLPVNVNGTDVFGPDGSSVFDALDNLSTALKTGDQAGVQAGIAALQAAQDKISSTLADVGARENRVDIANQTAQDAQVSLKGSLSQVQDVDIPSATVNLQLEQVAYQASLAVTAKVMQPSLLDFLQ